VPAGTQETFILRLGSRAVDGPPHQPSSLAWVFHDNRALALTCGRVSLLLPPSPGQADRAPALFEPIGDKLRRDIKNWAQGNNPAFIAYGSPIVRADMTRAGITFARARLWGGL
jgi:hypothetical protein